MARKFFGISGHVHGFCWFCDRITSNVQSAHGKERARILREATCLGTGHVNAPSLPVDADGGGTPCGGFAVLIVRPNEGARGPASDHAFTQLRASTSAGPDHTHATPPRGSSAVLAAFA